MRTSRDGSASAVVSVATSMPSLPSSTHSAFTFTRGSALPVASAVNCFVTVVDPRSTSRRWAVSRHQPLGCDSACTSCGGVARDSCGRVVSRSVVVCMMRQIRPMPTPIGIVEIPFLDVVLQVHRRGRAILDDAPIEVDDHQGAVRSRGKSHGPETFVRRPQEFGLVVRAPRAQRRAVVSEHDAPDEVGRRLGHEHVAVELGRQPIAAVDLRAARRRHLNDRAVGRPQDPYWYERLVPGLDRTGHTSLMLFTSFVRTS